MKMKPTTARLMAFAFAFSPGIVAGQKTTSSKPHILLLVADDFGWANAGWHRNKNISELKHQTWTSL